MGALYEPTALTTELWALAERIVSYLFLLGKREFSPLAEKFAHTHAL